MEEAGLTFRTLGTASGAMKSDKKGKGVAGLGDSKIVAQRGEQLRTSIRKWEGQWRIRLETCREEGLLT